MWAKGLFIVLMFALTALLTCAFEEDLSIMTELAREGQCKNLKEECLYPEKPCCDNRPCKCNQPMKDCRCHCKLGELFTHKCWEEDFDE
uniref:U8-Saltitoxin-Pre1a_1 n=1 Tax=Phidippus regius TaxID=1905328 RepID=A0A482ZC17_9ARAC